MSATQTVRTPQTQLADSIRRGTDILKWSSQGTWPVVDLAIRLWLAQAFFVSGVLKVGNWETALNLARYEYPVPWIDPVTAAYLGASIELVAPVLLALGLATRLAALPLLLLTLVMQHYYVALDEQLFWAWLFAGYLVSGAGPLSLDRLLAPGLADSALPLASAASRAARWMSIRVDPIYRLGLRLWLAGGLALAAIASAPHPWLAGRTLAVMPQALALACALLLAVGLATRPAALLLAAAALGAGMAGAPAAHLAWLVLLLAGLLLRGGGAISVDRLIPGLLERVLPGYAGPSSVELAALPRVVIVGAGFGGIACARELRHEPVSVTLIDRQNYHLFQPLLYQVATAGLAPSDIASPIRELFREQRNARVLLGSVTTVDRERREVHMDGKRIPYDYLVLATGASHSYFGRDDWAPFAPGLKRVEDATEVRRRLLLAFERAEASDDAAERDAQMTFLIVGGGPTGVELAGAIAELARYGMAQDFRDIDPAQARVILVQSAPRILPTFPEPLSAQATRALQALGVQIMTHSRVTDIDDAGVLVNGERIASRTVLWAAGVVASPAAAWLGAEADRAGRVPVGPDLTVTPRSPRPGRDSRFPGSRRRPSKAADTQPASLPRGSRADRRLRPSPTGIRAVSPPSAARPPWSTSAGSGYTALRLGGCGAWCMCSSCWECATGSPSCGTGSGPISPTAAARA